VHPEACARTGPSEVGQHGGEHMAELRAGHGR
jgi:hypothetical protein